MSLYTDKHCDNVAYCIVNPRGQILMEKTENEDGKPVLQLLGIWDDEVYTAGIDDTVRRHLRGYVGICTKTISSFAIEEFSVRRTYRQKTHYYYFEWNCQPEDVSGFDDCVWLYPEEIVGYARTNKLVLRQRVTRGLELLKPIMAASAAKGYWPVSAFTEIGIYQLNNGDLVAITSIDEENHLCAFASEEIGRWDPAGILESAPNELLNIHHRICDLPFIPDIVEKY